MRDVDVWNSVYILISECMGKLIFDLSSAILLFFARTPFDVFIYAFCICVCISKETYGYA